MAKYNQQLTIESEGNLLSTSVREATIETFTKTFSSISSYKVNAVEPDHNNLIGIISFVGTLHWVFMLEIPKETALFLSTKFVGFEIPFESEDMVDLVGELINLIAGTVITKLDKMGIKVQMSVPTVAKHRDVIPVLHGLSVLEDHFTITGHPFAAKVALLTETSLRILEDTLLSKNN